MLQKQRNSVVANVSNVTSDLETCCKGAIAALDIDGIEPLSKVLTDMLPLQKNPRPVQIKSLYHLSLNSIATNVTALKYDAKHEFLSSIVYPDIQRDIMIELLKVNCEVPCAPLASLLIKRKDFEEALSLCPKRSYPEKYALEIFLGIFNCNLVRTTLTKTMIDAECMCSLLSFIQTIFKGCLIMDSQSKVFCWLQKLCIIFPHCLNMMMTVTIRKLLCKM